MTTWRGTIGAALLIAVLGVTPVPAQADRRQQAPPVPPRTQAPPPLPPLPVMQLEERLKGDRLGQVFSFSSSEPVSIKDLLLLVVQDTSLSLVLDPDVEGTFTGDLKNVTLAQALDAALQPLNIDYAVENNILHVSRRKMATRVFNLNYVATRRQATRTIGVSTAVGSAGSGSAPAGATPAAAGEGFPGGGLASTGSGVSVTSFDSTDLFGEVEKGIQTLVSPDARYNLDRKAGLVQVSDYPDRLDRIGLYLDLVQLRVNRQIQIQAKVLEIDLNEGAAAGVDWSAVLRRAGDGVSLPQSPASPAQPFAAGVTIRDFTALLEALATEGDVHVLSSPRVAAMNNEPMIVRVGTQDVYFVTTSQHEAATGRVLQTSVSPHPIEEGMVLSVTPQVGGDGIITMSISPRVTERTGQARSRLGDTVPILSARETDTLVRVREGETVLIGGLLQERVTRETSKAPVLGHLPVVGGLFRRESRSTRRTELVILLTPTIVAPAAIAADAAREPARPRETPPPAAW
jgi:MSHA biogenesis protein MshL